MEEQSFDPLAASFPEHELSQETRILHQTMAVRPSNNNATPPHRPRPVYVPPSEPTSSLSSAFADGTNDAASSRGSISTTAAHTTSTTSPSLAGRGLAVVAGECLAAYPLPSERGMPSNKSAFTPAPPPLSQIPPSPNRDGISLSAERIMTLCAKEVFIHDAHDDSSGGNTNLGILREKLREALYPRDALGLASNGTATDGYIPYRTGKGRVAQCFLEQEQDPKREHRTDGYDDDDFACGPAGNNREAVSAQARERANTKTYGYHTEEASSSSKHTRPQLFRPKPPTSTIYPNTNANGQVERARGRRHNGDGPNSFTAARATATMTANINHDTDPNVAVIKALFAQRNGIALSYSAGIPSPPLAKCGEERREYAAAGHCGEQVDWGVEGWSVLPRRQQASAQQDVSVWDSTPESSAGTNQSTSNNRMRNLLHMLSAEEGQNRTFLVLEESSAVESLRSSDVGRLLSRFGALHKRHGSGAQGRMGIRRKLLEEDLWIPELERWKRPEDSSKSILTCSVEYSVPDLIEAEFDALSMDLTCQSRSADAYLPMAHDTDFREKDGHGSEEERLHVASTSTKAALINISVLHRTYGMICGSLWREEQREWVAHIVEPAEKAAKAFDFQRAVKAVVTGEGDGRSAIVESEYGHWYVPFVDEFCQTFYEKLRVAREESTRWKFMNLLQQVEADEVEARHRLVVEWMGCGPRCIHCRELISKTRMKVEREMRRVSEEAAGARISTEWVLAVNSSALPLSAQNTCIGDAPVPHSHQLTAAVAALVSNEDVVEDTNTLEKGTASKDVHLSDRRKEGGRELKVLATTKTTIVEAADEDFINFMKAYEDEKKAHSADQIPIASSTSTAASAGVANPLSTTSPSSDTIPATYARDLRVFDHQAAMRREELEQQQAARLEEDDTVPEALLLASDMTCRLTNFIDHYYTREYIEKAYAEIKTFVDVALQVTSAWVNALRRRNLKRMELLNQVIANLESSVRDFSSTDEANTAALEFLKLPEDPVEAIYVGEWKERRLIEMDAADKRQQAVNQFLARQRYLASNRLSFLAEKAMWGMEEAMETFQAELTVYYWEGRARIGLLAQEAAEWSQGLVGIHLVSIELILLEDRRRATIRAFEHDVYTNYLAYFHNTFKRVGTLEGAVRERLQQSLSISEHRHRLRIFKSEDGERAATLAPHAAFLNGFMSSLVALGRHEECAWARALLEGEAGEGRAEITASERRSRALLDNMGPSGAAMLFVIKNQNHPSNADTSSVMAPRPHGAAGERRIDDGEDTYAAMSIRGGRYAEASKSGVFGASSSAANYVYEPSVLLSPVRRGTLLLGERRDDEPFAVGTTRPTPRDRVHVGFLESITSLGLSAREQREEPHTTLGGKGIPVAAQSRLSVQGLPLRQRSDRTEAILRAVGDERRSSVVLQQQRRVSLAHALGIGPSSNAQASSTARGEGLTQEASFSVALLAMKKLEELTSIREPADAAKKEEGKGRMVTAPDFVAFGDDLEGPEEANAENRSQHDTREGGEEDTRSDGKDRSVEQSIRRLSNAPRPAGGAVSLPVGAGAGFRRPSIQEIAFTATHTVDLPKGVRTTARRSIIAAGLLSPEATVTTSSTARLQPKSSILSPSSKELVGAVSFLTTGTDASTTHDADSTRPRGEAGGGKAQHQHQASLKSLRGSSTCNTRSLHRTLIDVTIDERSLFGASNSGLFVTPHTSLGIHDGASYLEGALGIGATHHGRKRATPAYYGHGTSFADGDEITEIEPTRSVLGNGRAEHADRVPSVDFANSRHALFPEAPTRAPYAVSQQLLALETCAELRYNSLHGLELEELEDIFL